jgi:hypothetical protein
VKYFSALVHLDVSSVEILRDGWLGGCKEKNKDNEQM